MNPNNCQTCDHHKINRDPELHCYMFKDEPTERCGQHTGNKMPRTIAEMVEQSRYQDVELGTLGALPSIEESINALTKAAYGTRPISPEYGCKIESLLFADQYKDKES